MTFDPRTVVAAVQQAGEAVYGALDVVRRAREAQQVALLDGLQTNPFHPAAESAFHDLKTLSRLALQLDQIEQELRAHYAAAATLGDGHGTALIEAASPPQRSPLALAAPQTPAPATDRKPRGARRAQAAPTAPANTEASTSSAIHAPGVNAQRLRDFVAAQIGAGQRRTPRLSRAAIARGAGISQGSIGFTLRRLLDSGQLREPEPGHFELG